MYSFLYTSFVIFYIIYKCSISVCIGSATHSTHSQRKSLFQFKAYNFHCTPPHFINLIIPSCLVCFWCDIIIPHKSALVNRLFKSLCNLLLNISKYYEIYTSCTISNTITHKLDHIVIRSGIFIVHQIRKSNIIHHIIYSGINLLPDKKRRTFFLSFTGIDLSVKTRYGSKTAFGKS